MKNLSTPLPQDFEKLAAAASVKRSSNFGKDPDLRTVGERTYQAFAVVEFSPTSGLPRQRDWRHIPYALWLQGGQGLHPHSPLTQHYLDIAVPEALQSRRPLKWGRSLLHTYLEQFTPEDTLFQKLAQTARRFFQDKRVIDALLETQAGGLTRLITTLDILAPFKWPMIY
jgi:hypothetical protein